MLSSNQWSGQSFLDAQLTLHDHMIGMDQHGSMATGEKLPWAHHN